MGRLALEDRPVAEVTLLVLLVQVTIIAAILILLPLLWWSREGVTIPGRWSCLVYFAALGFGFILIEIAMLQRFTLFLGQPVYTLAAILASLLVFTGIGSALAERLTRNPSAGTASDHSVSIVDAVADRPGEPDRISVRPCLYAAVAHCDCRRDGRAPRCCVGSSLSAGIAPGSSEIAGVGSMGMGHKRVLHRAWFHLRFDSGDGIWFSYGSGHRWQPAISSRTGLSRLPEMLQPSGRWARSKKNRSFIPLPP